MGERRSKLWFWSCRHDRSSFIFRVADCTSSSSSLRLLLHGELESSASLLLTYVEKVKAIQSATENSCIVVCMK